MTTGSRAFEGRRTASTIAAILAAEPKPTPPFSRWTPPALERTVKNCLAKDPDDRVQTAHDVSAVAIDRGGRAGRAIAGAAPAGRQSRDRLAGSWRLSDYCSWRRRRHLVDAQPASRRRP